MARFELSHARACQRRLLFELADVRFQCGELGPQPIELRLILRSAGDLGLPVLGQPSFVQELRLARFEALLGAALELVVVAELEDFCQDALAIGG